MGYMSLVMSFAASPYAYDFSYNLENGLSISSFDPVQMWLLPLVGTHLTLAPTDQQVSSKVRG